MKDKIIEAFETIAEKFKDFSEGKIAEITIVHSADDYSMALAVRSAISGEAPVRLMQAASVSFDEEVGTEITHGVMVFIEARSGGIFSGPMLTKKVVRFS